MANVDCKCRSGLTTQLVSDVQMERRQSCILAADMAGYSSWMAVDEEEVIRRLRRARSEVIDPTLAEHGGRIVRVMGDGLLVEFTSSVSAVRTAIAIQHSLTTLDVAGLDGRKVRFRIGVNTGNVIVDGDDVLGNCVNVAARLESISPVGGICLSRAVHDQVTSRINTTMTPLGARYLKNIPEPVEIWVVDLDGKLVTSITH